ncbi:GtrA family protein [Agathobaculum sp. LCP25S3_E8]|uniref:GtrA family protein n=1 Tax=Agathobaculum sp. LCP25S3_E8 TaxID=3438735 RepID=UPI003F8F54AF
MIDHLKKIFSNQLVRFLIAGGVNTAFSYLCFVVLMVLFRNKELAVTLNLLIAVLFNYNMSSRFVFKNRQMSIGQIVKFYVVYFVTYPINILHLHVTVDIWHWDVYVSQFVTLFYLPFINYFLQKKFVFHSNKNKGA